MSPFIIIIIIGLHHSTAYVDVAYCYKQSNMVCWSLSVCQSVTAMSPASDVAYLSNYLTFVIIIIIINVLFSLPMDVASPRLKSCALEWLEVWFATIPDALEQSSSGTVFTTDWTPLMKERSLPLQSLAFIVWYFPFWAAPVNQKSLHAHRHRMIASATIVLHFYLIKHFKQNLTY